MKNKIDNLSQNMHLENRIQPASSEDVTILNNSLMDFNISETKYHKSPPWTDLHYVIKDSDNNIISGIESYLMRDSVLQINTLFVNENYRGNGYGTILLEKVEEEARIRGAYMAILDTFSFQGALKFYQKNGYEIFATLDDFPMRGSIQYYMKKQLIIK